MVPQALPALLAQQVQEYLVQRVQRVQGPMVLRELQVRVLLAPLGPQALELAGPLVRPGQELRELLAPLGLVLMEPQAPQVRAQPVLLAFQAPRALQAATAPLVRLE